MLKPKLPFKKIIYKKKIQNITHTNYIFPYIILNTTNNLWTQKQFDCLRIIIKRVLKKNHPLLICNHYNTKLTKKVAGSRMGKGKGAYSHTMHKAVKNSILFQFDCVSQRIALRIYKILWKKISRPIALYIKNKKILITKKK